MSIAQMCLVLVTLKRCLKSVCVLLNKSRSLLREATCNCYPDYRNSQQRCLLKYQQNVSNMCTITHLTKFWTEHTFTLHASKSLGSSTSYHERWLWEKCANECVAFIFLFSIDVKLDISDTCHCGNTQGCPYIQDRKTTAMVILLNTTVTP